MVLRQGIIYIYDKTKLDYTIRYVNAQVVKQKRMDNFAPLPILQNMKVEALES
jgi:hypothetical protein